jgi:hypothetical protein
LQYSIVQYSIVQYSIVQYSIVQYSISTVRYSIGITGIRIEILELNKICFILFEKFLIDYQRLKASLTKISVKNYTIANMKILFD